MARAGADFDNDGAVEILVNNSHDHPSLLKSLGEHGNWILLKLEGTKSNRDAIGAKVTARVGRSPADAGSSVTANQIVKIRESIVMKNDIMKK
jgi:hypothetical protein